MRKKETKTWRYGFTVLELIIVLLGIGAVFLVARPYWQQYLRKTGHTIADTDINGKIYLALERFKADRGTYPQSLEDLVFRPADDSPWNGPYLRKGLPEDPWHHPYVYQFPGVRNKLPYDLTSAGPDGQLGTVDDVINILKPQKSTRISTKTKAPANPKA